MKWILKCPCCGKATKSQRYSANRIRNEFIGATLECPRCNAGLIINKDLTCSDFGQYLVEAYKRAGCKFTREQALSSCLELLEN